MKTLLFSIILLTISFGAFANDGGMAYIDVKGINPVKNATDGTEIKFYGNDAENFMKLLPGFSRYSI